MTPNLDIRKFSAAEVVLFVIFAAGLLISYFIVKTTNKIRLTEKRQLEVAGVAVSVPIGRGWETSRSWQYEPQRNCFTLTAFWNSGSAVAPFVQCRYVLAAENLSAEQRLTQVAAKAKIETVIPIRKEKALAPLTETELSVLNILATEGAKTAPEIRDRIKLTREHTARLMKKLYEAGYLERDTRKMPYAYRIKKEMLRILKKTEAKA